MSDPTSDTCRCQADPEFEKRWNTAIDVVLNSGLLFPHIGAFWQFCDGEITEDELRNEIP